MPFFFIDAGITLSYQLNRHTFYFLTNMILHTGEVLFSMLTRLEMEKTMTVEKAFLRVRVHSDRGGPSIG